MHVRVRHSYRYILCFRLFKKHLHYHYLSINGGGAYAP